MDLWNHLNWTCIQGNCDNKNPKSRDPMKFCTVLVLRERLQVLQY